MLFLGLHVRSSPFLWRAIPFFALIVLAAACREERPLAAPNPTASARVDAPKPTLGKVRPEEQHFADLAEKSPSSAGFYFDSAGRLIVVVRDRGDDALARSAVAEFVQGISDARLDTKSSLIQEGQFTFGELARWRDIIFDEVFTQVRGVTTLDLAEVTNRVEIGLSKSAAASLRASLPSQLAALGIDTSAIIYQVEDPEAATLPARSPRPAALSMFAGTSIGDRVFWDTLAGGIHIESNVKQCTLGIVADAGSVRGLVTVSHCSEDFWGLDSGPMYQPWDYRQVGSEYLDPAGWGCGFLTLDECRRSDASFYQIASTIPSAKGLIVRTQSWAAPGYGSGSMIPDTSRPYFMVDAVDNDQLVGGQYVHKVGRTTGWTWGQITHTCKDVESHGWPNTRRTLCTYESSMYVDGGDSGSPVFTPYGDGINVNTDVVKLNGIIQHKVNGPPFRSFFSKWDRIVTDLGALDPLAPAVLSTPSLSGGITVYYPSMSWAAVSGATRYNIFKDNPSGQVLIGTVTSTSFSDGNANVLQYTGGTEPTTSSKIKYYIYAVNGSQKSARSNVLWYVGASGSFNLTINGPSVVGPNTAGCGYWSAEVSGSGPIVSYTWSGLFSGTDSYITGTVPTSGGQLWVVVVDNNGKQTAYLKTITYDPNNTDNCS
ncbi:MAG: hypothetical protein HOP28_00015 [Gemmatimonadales bacterium]|nr:hypothetical protein [Gemmatimonadales bacterium]